MCVENLVESCLYLKLKRGNHDIYIINRGEEN